MVILQRSREEGSVVVRVDPCAKDFRRSASEDEKKEDGSEYDPDEDSD